MAVVTPWGEDSGRGDLQQARGIGVQGLMGDVTDVCLFPISSVKSFRGLKQGFDMIGHAFQNQHCGEVVSTSYREWGDWSVK